MAQFKEAKDLAEYFYAAGKKAAKSDLATYQGCAAVPLVDSLSITALPKSVAPDGTNSSTLDQKEELTAKNHIHQTASCASPRAIKTLPSEPVCKLLNHETAAKFFTCQVADYGCQKTISTNLPSEPVSEQLNVETRTKVVIRQAANSSPPIANGRLPFLPLNKPICDENATLGKSESFAQVWSDLTDCLEIFVSNVYSAEVAPDNQNIPKRLEVRLSEAVRVMSSKDVTCQSINIPFDNLITVCNVFSSIGCTVWDKDKAAFEAANAILTGKALWAMCSFAMRGQVTSKELQEPMNYESGTVLIRFGGCRDNGEIEDVEKKLLATGAYVRDAEAAEFTEMSNGIAAAIPATGVQESVTCIRMQDSCHFWAYVGGEWRQRLEELDATYKECDVSDDELMGDDGGEIYLTKRPKKNDVLLMAAEDCSSIEFEVSTVRVRVIDVINDKALLWCVDLATYCIQEWSFLRQCPKKMLRIPYQAKLCRITGVVAKPSVEIITKCCTLLLTLFTRWTFALKDSTLSNFFTVFLSLSCSSVKALRRPALLCVSIGTALIGSEKQSNLKFNNLVSKYVECVRKMSADGKVYKDLEELRTATQTIRNLLFSFAELRKYFAQIGGFPIVMQLVLSKNLDGDLEMEMWKLLRVLFGTGDLGKENETRNHSVKFAQKFPTKDVPVFPPCKGGKPVLPKRSIQCLLQERKVASLVAEMAEKKEHTAEVSSPHVAGVTFPGPTHGANTTSCQYLIRGKMFRFQPNDETIMLQQRKVNEIVHISTIQVVCGLLNSDTGGAIYFGLGPHNVIDGINVARKQRDDIRIGFDKLFDRCLSPRINPSACDLSYIKVFEPNEPKDLGCAQHTLHIIKLEVKASPGRLYKMNSGQYIVIQGGAARVAITQELREKIIRLAEQQFRR